MKSKFHSVRATFGNPPRFAKGKGEGGGKLRNRFPTNGD